MLLFCIVDKSGGKFSFFRFLYLFQWIWGYRGRRIFEV